MTQRHELYPTPGVPGGLQGAFSKKVQRHESQSTVGEDWRQRYSNLQPLVDSWFNPDTQSSAGIADVSLSAFIQDLLDESFNRETGRLEIGDRQQRKALLGEGRKIIEGVLKLSLNNKDRDVAQAAEEATKGYSIGVELLLLRSHPKGEAEKNARAIRSTAYIVSAFLSRKFPLRGDRAFFGYDPYSRQFLQPSLHLELGLRLLAQEIVARRQSK